MVVFLILALVIAIFAVIFALQNLISVTVTFLAWDINASLALIILATLAMGVLLGWLVTIPGGIRGKVQLSNHKKKLTAAETEKVQFQKRIDDAERRMMAAEQKVLATEADMKRKTEELATFTAELELQHAEIMKQANDNSSSAQDSIPSAY